MKKQRRGPVGLAISFFLLFFAVIGLIFMFMHRNGERIVEQNQRYLESSASQMAKYIDEQFDSYSRNIRMVAALYEMQLESAEFDYHLLNELNEPTPFDHLRFVGPDGMSWSGEGVCIDGTDREYYQQGIRGESGICYVDSSRFNSESLLIFYTPLHYEGEIIGVVNGVLNTSHLAEQLDNDLFGRSVVPFICKPDGTLVVQSSSQNINPISPEVLSVKTLPEVMAALSEGRSFTYRYKGSKGEGLAYMAPLGDGEMMMIQTFPSTIRKELTDQANHETLKFEIAFIVLFLGYVLLMACYYVRRARRLSREKHDLSQIVDSIKRLYRRFVVFELDKDVYEYLEEGDITSIGLPPKGRFSDWVKGFNSEMEVNPEFWGSMGDLTAENLRATLTREKWYAHREYPTPDGRWERLSLIKLDPHSDVTNRILGAVEDITEIRQRDEENRQALETAFHAAEAASFAKSEFLSRMSHDIRTPMNAIIGLTAIMGAHLDDPERLKDCLSKVTYSSKHLLSLINEVLDMSKIESGKLVLSEDEFSIPMMIDELLQIVQPNVNAKHQDLSVNAAQLVHETVIGDSQRLQQICVNILSNAVKYTPEGGTISMTISERQLPNSPMSDYTFVFRDDGIGMTPEFIERIFKPFERADDERISNTQGTGLGMSIAHSMVKLMGGTISVESELGKGSVFTVQLSLRPQITDEAKEKRLAGLPVLVVDDEQIICESTCLLLEELGLEGEWAISGEEAVERVAKRHEAGEDFFAVIMDWRMPGMDGIEATRAIRRSVGGEVPVIILSSYDWSEVEAEAKAAGISTFIAKPLFKSRLHKMFVTLIDDPEPAEEVPLIPHREDYTGKKALLVEDNVLNQEIAKEILEMTGLSVDVAENGRLAVERFEASAAGEYDIVFMDIQMPVMNGYESAKAIRSLSREDAQSVPIIALSANTFSDDVRASLEAGMDHHIGKPINVEELKSMLEKWIG